MGIGSALRLVLAGGATGLVPISALTATNTVSVSNAGRSIGGISVDDKKPKPACNGITVTNLVLGTKGTTIDDLLLGTSGPDSMTGKNSDDCLVGGGGNDTLNGAKGIDVCIGGPGTDVDGGGCRCETSSSSEPRP